MTSAEDVAREWLQGSDAVVMFGSAETIDATVQSLAAIIGRERKEADARAEAAEAESARLRDALNVALGWATGGMDGDWRDCDHVALMRSALNP